MANRSPLISSSRRALTDTVRVVKARVYLYHLPPEEPSGGDFAATRVRFCASGIALKETSGVCDHLSTGLTELSI